MRIFPCLLLLNIVLGAACASTVEPSRPLSEIETNEIQPFIGTYTGNIYSKKTRDPDALKPLVAEVKLQLTVTDGTMVLTADKDLSAGECPADIGRFTSLNFSKGSMLATFAYENSSCPTPLNVEGLLVEAKTFKSGEIKLTTKLPRVLSTKKAAKGSRKTTFLYGVFAKDAQAEPTDALEDF